MPQLSNIQLLIQRKHNLNERKKKIALLASDVIENPEENVRYVEITLFDHLVSNSLLQTYL